MGFRLIYNFCRRSCQRLRAEMRSCRGRMASCMSRSRRWAPKWLKNWAKQLVTVQQTFLWLKRANLNSRSLKFWGEACSSTQTKKYTLCSYTKEVNGRIVRFAWLLIQFNSRVCILKSSVPWSCFSPLMFFISNFHRFVRREKEIAESRFEISQEETLRYRLRAENLEQELKEVQDSMKSSKERMEVCVIKSW